MSQGWFFVVRAEAQLLATVAIVFEDPLVWGSSAGEAGYVHMLMVDRSVSGRGIGTTLLALTGAVHLGTRAPSHPTRLRANE